MASTKREYLIEKGLIPREDFGKIYFAYFNKDEDKVETFEKEIWDIAEYKYSSYDKGKFTDHIGKSYIFNKSFPDSIEFFEGEDQGDVKGMASGFGDLLRWCYYGFLNKEDRDKKYQELLKERNSWGTQDNDIIMPMG
jgi:hypothetical protein